MNDHGPTACPTPPPRLGEPAPRFEADSTHGVLKLEDFSGGWLVLFSHPADFTPVCATEFLALAELHPQFRQIGCELVGLSADSVYAHIAWVRSIEAAFGQAVTFPVLADPGLTVATAYGLVMPAESATETVRGVFVIDDRQIVRAMLYYPLTTGRDAGEILRLVRALQTTDRHGVATPANWRPGDKVIVPPPRTQEMAVERLAASGAECRDWYFCLRDIK